MDSHKILDQILEEVTESLAYVHKKGIVNRDLKSDNVVFYDENSDTSVYAVIIDL